MYFEWCVIPHTTVSSMSISLWCCDMVYLQHGDGWQNDVAAVTPCIAGLMFWLLCKPFARCYVVSVFVDRTVGRHVCWNVMWCLLSCDSGAACDTAVTFLWTIYDNYRFYHCKVSRHWLHFGPRLKPYNQQSSSSSSIIVSTTSETVHLPCNIKEWLW